MCLDAMLRNERDAVLVPIPQYPLYSAAITLYGGTMVGYQLDEHRGWALNLAELRRAIRTARAGGKLVRGLVFINPGNPTGQCLPEDNIRELIKFAHDERIVLMADEVYQVGSLLGSGAIPRRVSILCEGGGMGRCALRRTQHAHSCAVGAQAGLPKPGAWGHVAQPLLVVYKPYSLPLFRLLDTFGLLQENVYQDERMRAPCRTILRVPYIYILPS